MKKIFSLVVLLASGIASAATLVPVQLLNPVGSTAGQMLVSSGASAAPTWSSSVSAITSTGQTNFINTSNGSAIQKLTGNGATTPNKFIGVLNGLLTIYSSNGSTQLLALDDSGNALFTGSVAASQTGGIVGTTTNNNANSGSVGEYVTNAQTGTPMTTGTAVGVTSISLTAGDWDVSGVFATIPAATTTTSYVGAGISTVANTLPSANTGARSVLSVTSAASVGNELATPTFRISLASTTTVYLIGYAQFATSTMTGNGFIRARRVR
jgi:hypothetical protein